MSGQNALVPALVPELSAVQAGLMRIISEGPHPELLGPFFSRGKLFRPQVTLVGAGATGGAPSRAVVLAQAVELLHGASLVHDDIIDEADTRRGGAALHRALQPGVALVLGDYLIFRALELVTDLDALPGVDTVGAVRLVTRLVARCCRGQIDELHASGRPVTEEAYVRLVRDKTGALFAASLAGGGLVAGGSPEVVELLSALGDALGVVYQIYDDVLDIWGDSQAIGKPTGNSAAMGRPHAAWIYADGPASCLRDPAVFQSILRLQERHVRAAEALIDRLPPSEYAVALRRLTHHFASWGGAVELLAL